MQKNKSLVIVESPTKASTIKKYLGKDYKVRSSVGHLVDLPKSRLAVDVNDNFKPDYITIRGKGKILNELKKEAKKSSRVYLAADSDREGEAISYHIKQALKKENPAAEIKRIVFNEITQSAIKQAMKNPQDINIDLVNAQKARRILDRLVGYNLSPLLWEKIKKGLSAGRVQSVALRVICEREEEIDRFVPQEYWTIQAFFKKENKKFTARLVSIDGKKPDLKCEKDAQQVLDRLKDQPFVIEKLEEKQKTRRPQAPLTTSKMQQAAGSRLGFGARKTMRLAQQLYEGIKLDKGPVGLITYMRTDSTRISEQAGRQAREYVKNEYSGKYVPDKPNIFKNRKGSQDAHEAIRPTSVFRNPNKLKQYLSRDQLKLYRLIWEQFVASQMSPALLKQVRADIRSNGAVFRANGQSVLFDGFLKVLTMTGATKETPLPEMNNGEELKPLEVTKEVHYTEPPPRFTDASLVKFLEESGIGRPSTYAPIISTLIQRYYIQRENRYFVPTFLGKLTNKLLVSNFAGLMDLEFTSNMEQKLDRIAEGELDWVSLLREFYPSFIETVQDAKKRLESYKGITDEETDYTCEKCGKKMIKKLGKYGYFLACSGFPDCRNTRPLPLGNCPRQGCEGKVVQKRSRRRKTFYGCTRYPECEFTTWKKPAPTVCPLCGSIMTEQNVDGRSILVCLGEDCGHKLDKARQHKEEAGTVLQHTE
ncbi:MAG: type I DNA topoisomerase [Spirochaetota bacterium]